MTSKLPAFLGLLLATPLCACEYTEQLDPDGADTDASGTDSSDTDDGPAGSSVGEGSGASSTSVSATGPDGTSTSVGPTGSDETSGGDALCEPGEALVSLTLDDEQTTISYELDGSQSSALGTEFILGEGGAILVRAAYSGDGPSSSQGSGYVHLPPGALTAADSWLCFDDTSTLHDDGNGAIVLEMNGLAELGACPDGVPVEGSITACLGDPSCGGELSVQGMIGLDPLEESSNGFGTNEIGGFERVAIDVGGDPANSGGQLGFRVGPVDDDGGTQVLPLEQTYFIVPLGHPDGGAVYCAGDGSTATYDGGFIRSVELVGLSRLGACADADETGSGFFCSNAEF